MKKTEDMKRMIFKMLLEKGYQFGSLFWCQEQMETEERASLHHSSVAPKGKNRKDY